MESRRRKGRRTQEERSAESSAAILDAAVELFAREGSRVSVSEIAKNAGFSHGLVLARFGSKANLIRSVTRRVQIQFSRTIASAAGNKTGIAALHAFVNSVFDIHEHPSPPAAAFAVLLGEAFGSNPEVKETFVTADRKAREFVAAMIRDAKNLNEVVASVAEDSTSVLIIGLLRGVVMQLVVNPDAFDPADLKSRLHTVLRDLLPAPNVS